MPNKPPSGPAGSGRLATVSSLMLAAVAVAGLIWLIWPADTSPPPQASHSTATGSAKDSMEMLSAAPSAATIAAMTPAERAAALAHWRERLERAQATLDSYRQTTQYPFDSRPASEHEDQLQPNRPVEEEQALHDGNGNVDPTVQIITSQSRVYVASGEAVLFTITARQRDGQTLPLAVTEATARAMPHAGSGALPAMVVAFNDQGQAGDLRSGDGIASALLVPAQSPLAQFDGTIRLQLAYQAGDRNGRHAFDIIYTPQVPAVWAGSFKDTIEAGSLVLRIPVDVRQAGRFIINARIDDADGKPLALLTFNDMLDSGPQQLKLSLFGKLIRDLKPRFPLSVRDVDGYLLRDTGFPDRVLMPRLTGRVHQTASHALTSFASSEWQSEERDRYLKEYGKDVAEAQTQVEALSQIDCQDERNKDDPACRRA
ncbi:hypothetical protein [Chitinimonas sp. BJYL2]|uniref:hypothetical protein n=1 Tax=Chitinimonas sp. BJYL2 TaxID=2976696 RepID=UPI0022B3493A|nr:hypothetical protein [Chitinimonas sp. BJYL2]